MIQQLRPRFILHVSPGLRKSIKHIGCHGEQNGYIAVTTDGVEGPWNYRWLDGEGSVILEQLYNGTQSSVNGLDAGQYFIEVTSNGICPMMRDSIRITEPRACGCGF